MNTNQIRSLCMYLGLWSTVAYFLLHNLSSCYILIWFLISNLTIVSQDSAV